MGVMRFLVPRRERVSSDAPQRAYMAGLDGIPWQCQVAWTDEGLAVTQQVDDSGNFYMPWLDSSCGELTLSTASLMQRDRPYHLSVELARGTLNRIRHQLAAWRMAGLEPSTDITDRIRQAMELLTRAVTSQQDPLVADEQAELAIDASLEIVQLLGEEYSDEVLAIRHRQAAKMTTIFAGDLHDKPLDENIAEAFLATFNAARIPFAWRLVEGSSRHYDWTLSDHQIQWCRRQGLRIWGGPLLKLDQRSVPDWLCLWEDDFENLQSYVLGHIEKTVQRYEGKCHLWHCASRVNVGNVLSLTEEQRLRLTLGAIQTVRRTDPNTPVIVSFTQPWAEYLATQPLDLSPLHFADALVRADLGLAGVGLELNLGYWPGGTLPRDLLDMSAQIDKWSQFGLPLLVMLTVPSGQGPDPLAGSKCQTLDGGSADGITLQSQKSLVEHLLPLLLSKTCVQAILWNQLDDSQPHDFPHGGLLDDQGHPKPAMTALAAIREEHLI